MNPIAKIIPVLILSLFLSAVVNAQKGGLVYYLKNNGKLVSTKDSADYSMVVLPPDTSSEKSLYVVYEYDKNGKVMLATSSKTNDINLLYQGRYIAYFPNGKKKRMGNFKNGDPTGREIDFYPNGKLYTVTNYTNGNIFLIECRDSTGNVLAENGMGKWIQYGNDDFINIQAQGNVKNGLREGQWNGSINFKYHLGNVISSSVTYTNFDDHSDFYGVEKYPEFPGGRDALGRFINSNIHYPEKAKLKRTQGKVQVRFVVESDGSLSGISIAQGLGNGCDEEALRIVRLLPNWNPGIIHKRQTSMPDSIPVYFSLTNLSVNIEIGSAQYMLMNSGYLVHRRDSADYFLAFTQNDTSGSKYHFKVKAFYPNGQIKFIGTSNTDKLRRNDIKNYFEPVLESRYTSFFPDGHQKSTCVYKNGAITGEETQYYPNGKIYNIKIHTTAEKVFYKECRDSTGSLLVENGIGKGVEFTDESFKNYVKGEVINGLQEGEWVGKEADTVNIVLNYDKGNLLSSAIIESSGNKLYTKAEVVPEFAGDSQSFGRFLVKNMRYPAIARDKHIMGRVIVGFIVEKDGTLSNVKIVKGIGGGCDEEAVRVIRLSPPWKPALANGKPVRVVYKVPIVYELSN